jgi:nucleotide-binding universal stress UspA family protein
MAAFSKILLPTDFSDFSNQAMEQALAWAAHFGAELHLLHVVTVHNYDPFNPDMGFPEVNIAGSLQQTAERQMEQIATMSRDEGPEVTQEIRTGFSPWNEIVTVAAEQNTDLIIMATHGRRGLEKLFLGSTAEKVLEHTPCPVLLLRPDQQGAMGKPSEIESIILPSDFSEAAGDAAPLAFELAQSCLSRLTLFHCVEQEVPPPYYAAGITSIFELNDEVLSVARQHLAKLIPDSLADKLDHDFVIREGRSAHELVQFARESGADLIVMATHGYTGLEQVLLGSTTDRVVRNAACPVLVVRSKA